MIQYTLRRIVFLSLTMLLTSILIFIIAQVIPGDVCRVILGREVGEAALVNCRQELGLNQPVYRRYFDSIVRRQYLRLLRVYSLLLIAMMFYVPQFFGETFRHQYRWFVAKRHCQ